MLASIVAKVGRIALSFGLWIKIRSLSWIKLLVESGGCINIIIGIIGVVKSGW